MKSYLRLNNEVLHHYNRTGKLDLAKDREAARRYFLEYVNVKMRHFDRRWGKNPLSRRGRLL